MRVYFPVRFLLASLFVVGMARSAHAQFSQRGSIGGIVTDSSGVGLPNAVVTLEDLDRIQKSSANTDHGGHYEFAQHMIGNDRVAVEILNFNKLVSGSLTIASQGARKQDLCQRCQRQ
jgi:hypothetical protein